LLQLNRPLINTHRHSLPILRTVSSTLIFSKSIMPIHRESAPSGETKSFLMDVIVMKERLIMTPSFLIMGNVEISIKKQDCVLMS
jgi:hypothetical protein